MPHQDLISHAARFFVLAEQAFRLDWSPYARFWDLFALPVVETASHLPAMAAAVKTVATLWDDILSKVAHRSLPGMLPPEAVPWHNRLVTAWKVRRTSNLVKRQGFARLALVRLDGCGMPEGQERPSRLPEWLAEAQKIASGEWRMANGHGPYWELDALAALAAWRPAARVITPPETLRKWVEFWLEVGRSDDPMKKGITAIALLNLPEADLQTASISPVPAVGLLQQLSKAIQFAAEKEGPDYLCLLDWQPVKGTIWPVAEMRNVAQAWLEVTRHKNRYHRCAAWQQLIRWNRAGSLAICGMKLVPELVKAVPTEEEAWVLWELAQWVPIVGRFTATKIPVSLLRKLESAWERYRKAWHPEASASAWLAGIRLHQAGLAAEPPESFLKAYISRLADESDNDVLFILAQWSPGAAAPGRWHRDWHTVWQQRLLDKNEDRQTIAAWALLRQSLEKEDSRSLRCTALELWRAETKASSEARDMLNAAFSRLQEVRAHLAAGEGPDFEKEPAPPAERHRPPLALPPGRIVGSEWSMENEELNMENGEWSMKHQEVTVKPNHCLVPGSPSR